MFYSDKSHLQFMNSNLISLQFSEGLIKIETYREMLLTQTQVLTLEPLKQVQEESFKLTVSLLNLL